VKTIQYSYSRVDCFKQCPYKFKLKYIDQLETVSDPEPWDHLICGKTIHKGIEEDLKAALEYYISQFPILTDLHINEIIKFEILIPKLKNLLKDINILQQEYTVETQTFKGILDLITQNDDGTVDIFDFKYSNNIDNYMNSNQLHLYKYFLEHQGFKVNKLGFIFIPKTFIRQKKDEDIYHFRKRLIQTVENSQIQLIEISYDEAKVNEFFESINQIERITEYSKNISNLCHWCEYEQFCIKGEDYMILPENKRRERKIDINPDMWLYGDSYVGKSTFVDQFDDLLFINTDGNTDNTTSPLIHIKDEVTVQGRLTTRKFAWEVFLDVVAELEKKQNSFKRICIDLVEDLYEHCRLYMYDKLGIEHEQDAGYGKGWDMVRTEYLSTIKRLKSLGYQIIYISKEIESEITLKNGTKITTIKPNIQDKVANILAGTVDLTARIFMDGQDRYIQLGKKENIFGGGRFNFKVDKVPLNKDDFIEALKEAQEGTITYSKVIQANEKSNVETSAEIKTEDEVKNEDEVKEEKKVRHRKRKSDEQETIEINEENVPFKEKN